ncbi:MAG: N-6 DNA methylase [Lachnospiraceae bacterium]
MEKLIVSTWEKLNKKFSVNQVFLLQIYFAFMVYRQVIRKEKRLCSIDEWRLGLLNMLADTFDYDVKEAAVRLSERIEWEVVENDIEVRDMINEYSKNIESYFSERISCPNRILGKLDFVIETLYYLSEVNGIYAGTPRSIERVAEILLNRQKVYRIADMCCGIGNLGLAIWKYVKQFENDITYYGVDVDPLLCDISRIRIYFHSFYQSMVVCDDILKGNLHKRETYDLVLLDIPRGKNKSLDNRLDEKWMRNIKQKKIYADWLYIIQELNCIDDTGKGIAIATQGTLVRKSEANLRREVLQKDWIEAIISLPANLYVNTRTGSEMILFNKNKSRDRKGKILFIDISKYYFRDSRSYYSITAEGFHILEDAYINYHIYENVSSVIDISEIDKENFSLKPIYYIDRQGKQKCDNDSVELKNIAKIVRGVQLKKEEEENLCRMGEAFYINIKDIQEGRIYYEGAKRITPKNKDWDEKFLINENDILLTSKGTSFKIAIVEEKPPRAYICGNITLLRVNEKRYHPYVLFEFLSSQKGKALLESIQSGSTIRVLNNENLGKLRIPITNSLLESEVGNQLKEKRKKYIMQMEKMIREYAVERKTLLELIGMEE